MVPDPDFPAWIQIFLADPDPDSEKKSYPDPDKKESDTKHW